MERNNGKIAIAIVAMFVVALSIIGFTYAYFVAQVQGQGTTDVRNVTVQAGTLKITYDHGDELDAQGIVPGWASDSDKYYDPKHSVTVDSESGETHITAASLATVGAGNVSVGSTNPVAPVTFDITNNSKKAGEDGELLPAYYGIVLDIETNSITDKENFKVTLATEDDSITGLAAATQLNASGEQKVSNVITIPGGATQEFELSAQYDNIESPQDQGKAVKFAVRVVGLNLVDDKYLDADGNEW